MNNRNADQSTEPSGTDSHGISQLTALIEIPH